MSLSDKCYISNIVAYKLNDTDDFDAKFENLERLIPLIQVFNRNMVMSFSFLMTSAYLMLNQNLIDHDQVVRRFISQTAH